MLEEKLASSEQKNRELSVTTQKLKDRLVNSDRLMDLVMSTQSSKHVRWPRCPLICTKRTHFGLHPYVVCFLVLKQRDHEIKELRSKMDDTSSKSPMHEKGVPSQGEEEAPGDSESAVPSLRTKIKELQRYNMSLQNELYSLSDVQKSLEMANREIVRLKRDLSRKSSHLCAMPSPASSINSINSFLKGSKIKKKRRLFDGDEHPLEKERPGRPLQANSSLMSMPSIEMTPPLVDGGCRYDGHRAENGGTRSSSPVSVHSMLSTASSSSSLSSNNGHDFSVDDLYFCDASSLQFLDEDLKLLDEQTSFSMEIP